MSARRSLGFVVASQFLGSVADGALVLVAIRLLQDRHAPDWTQPVLRVTFYTAYVLLAAFAGAVADAWPKQRVLLATTGMKLCGCGLLLAGLHPLLAYAFIGVGAVAHAPARYGILSELLPEQRLVAGNGWLEGATISGSLAGILLGSALLAPWMFPGTGNHGLHAAAVLAVVYLASALACVPVRAAAAADAQALRRPRELLARFLDSIHRLSKDRQAGLCLVATSVFWSAAAVLQFLVLRWSAEVFGLSLSGGAVLQALFAVALIGGAAAAGRWVTAERALGLLPAGLAAGAVLLVSPDASQPWAATLVLAALGLLSGLMLVPLNALLQLRGSALMHPGQAIASQHFAENVASLVLLAVYGVLTALDASVQTCLFGLGLVVTTAMATLLMVRRADS